MSRPNDPKATRTVISSKDIQPLRTRIDGAILSTELEIDDIPPEFSVLLEGEHWDIPDGGAVVIQSSGNGQDGGCVPVRLDFAGGGTLHGPAAFASVTPKSREDIRKNLVPDVFVESIFMAVSFSIILGCASLLWVGDIIAAFLTLLSGMLLLFGVKTTARPLLSRFVDPGHPRYRKSETFSIPDVLRPRFDRDPA